MPAKDFCYWKLRKRKNALSRFGVKSETDKAFRKILISVISSENQKQSKNLSKRYREGGDISQSGGVKDLPCGLLLGFI